MSSALLNPKPGGFDDSASRLHVVKLKPLRPSVGTGEPSVVPPVNAVHGQQPATQDAAWSKLRPQNDSAQELASTSKALKAEGAPKTTSQDSTKAQTLASLKSSLLWSPCTVFSPRELECVKELGTGGFATVMLCSVKRAGQPAQSESLMAVKYLRNDMLHDTVARKDFQRELRLIGKLRHRNIVEFLGFGSFTQPNPVRGDIDNLRSVADMYLVQEFMNQGSLYRLLKKQASSEAPLYSDADALRWSMDVANGLLYLHELQPMVIHRDIKLENILLKGKDIASSEAKVCDFGLSTNILRQTVKDSAARTTGAPAGDSAHKEQETKGTSSSQQQQQPPRSVVINTSSIIYTRSTRLANLAQDETFCLSGRTGSLLYMAPEVYRQERYNEKVDVFSLAVIMYELFCRKPVLMSLCAVSPATQSSLEQFAAKVSTGARLPIPSTWHPKLAGLITDMWQEDPKARPSMKQVLSRLQQMQELGIFEPAPQEPVVSEPEIPVPVEEIPNSPSSPAPQSAAAAIAEASVTSSAGPSPSQPSCSSQCVIC